MTDHIVPAAKGKIQQILDAGQKQLSPQDYDRLVMLIGQLQAHGMTAYLNTEIGRLISQINWELEISESPEWEEALIECDRTYLGNELKDMYIIATGEKPPRLGKKELCRKMYMMGAPRVVEVMAPLMEKEESPEPVESAPPAASQSKTLFDDTYKGTRYTYGLQYRPLGYAAVPDGWIIQSDRPHPKFPKFGTVQYTRPLTQDEIENYQLVKVDV